MFPKYPEIKARISAEVSRQYHKQIFNPLNDLRMKELLLVNKNSTYKEIQIRQIHSKPSNQDLKLDLKRTITKVEGENKEDINMDYHEVRGDDILKNQLVAKKIIESNFNTNMNQVN